MARKAASTSPRKQPQDKTHSQSRHNECDHQAGLTRCESEAGKRRGSRRLMGGAASK